MLYCTKCKSICEDSTQTCPNCKRSRGLRPVKPEDDVFFLKVSEGEAAELALLFEQNAVRHAIHPVKGGFSTSVYDPEYLPTDKDIEASQKQGAAEPGSRFPGQRPRGAARLADPWLHTPLSDHEPGRRRRGGKGCGGVQGIP